jgi:3',5'-cyclic AMP phosphodiesterase CpdA
MPDHFRLAITADLHWGHHPLGDEATLALRDFLLAEPPEVLILGGDVGTVDHFNQCLALFDELDVKALVPGNHDIWVDTDDPRGDSLQVYCQHLPAVCTEHSFHYLDSGPLLFPQANLAVAGSINWYDYSWAIDSLRQEMPDWEERLRTKVFSRGRHNDARFVRWPLDDVRFTMEVVATLEQHLETTFRQAEKTIVVTHHPAFQGLSFPRPGPLTLDGLLWEAFSGNAALEALLLKHADRIPLVFSGHTHRSRENTLGPIHGYNIGGDYHFKRLLLIDWLASTLEAHTFGDPEARRG